MSLASPYILSPILAKLRECRINYPDISQCKHYKPSRPMNDRTRCETGSQPRGIARPLRVRTQPPCQSLFREIPHSGEKIGYQTGFMHEIRLQRMLRLRKKLLKSEQPTGRQEIKPAVNALGSFGNRSASPS